MKEVEEADKLQGYGDSTSVEEDELMETEGYMDLDHMEEEVSEEDLARKVAAWGLGHRSRGTNSDWATSH